MKAEIDNENKVKFFAQYWGQKVYRKPEVPGFESTVGGSISDERVPKTGYLELKSLSDISDEDATEVAKYRYTNPQSFSWVELGKLIVKEMIHKSTVIEHYEADFLRSRGYLVPFLGLSCEELIEAGWAKYKE